jgi:hypothetical protein
MRAFCDPVNITDVVKKELKIVNSNYEIKGTYS